MWNGASVVTLSAENTGMAELYLPGPFATGTMQLRLRAALSPLGAQQPEQDGPQIEVGWSDDFAQGVNSTYLNIRSYRSSIEPPMGSVNLRTMSNGGNGETSLSGALAVQNWHTYKIEWADASVEFYLDDTWRTTETANVPSGESLPFRIRVRSQSMSDSVSVDVDWVMLTEP